MPRRATLCLLVTCLLCLDVVSSQSSRITLCGLVYQGSCRADCNEGWVFVNTSSPNCPTPSVCCRPPPSSLPPSTQAPLAGAPPNGTWGPWGAWTVCGGACGFMEGTQTRQRGCLSPHLQCQGPSLQRQQCDRPFCFQYGYWGEWEAWSACANQCGRGDQHRRRVCIPPAVGICPQGNDTDSRDCQSAPCPAPAEWSAWSSWSACSTSCGSGTRQRMRTCPVFASCDGPANESAACFLQSCPGQWAAWGAWSACSRSCGLGFQSRNRKCPTDGPPCVGPNEQTVYCYSQECQGEWMDWSAWGACSTTCGNGTRSRYRTCSPSGPQCNGAAVESVECRGQECAGQAGPWGAWSACSTTCGLGSQQRLRGCQPAAGQCSEPLAEAKSCSERPCEDCGVVGPSSRILGGRETERCRWPWMANLRISTLALPVSPHLTVCGAVLLDSNSLLTSAVCADYLSFTEAAGVVADVVVGEHLTQQQDLEQQVMQYATLVRHPNYTSPPPEQFPLTVPRPLEANNVAVIQLKGEVTPAACRRQICLPDPWHVISTSVCVVAGWGRVSRVTNFTAFALREAGVNLLPVDECERRLVAAGVNLPPGGLGEGFLCTDSSADGAATCEGDEGGALMCQDQTGLWTLQGLVSDFLCRTDLPTLYIRVSPSLQWVRDVMKENH